MSKTDNPVDGSNEKVDEREDNNENLVSITCWILLILITSSSISDEEENDSISEDSSNNKDILDEDPGSESRDTNSNRWTGGDGGYQEGCKG